MSRRAQCDRVDSINVPIANMEVNPMRTDGGRHDKSPNQLETDSEDDQVIENARTTAELARYDHGVLHDESDHEQLLSRPTKGGLAAGLAHFTGNKVNPLRGGGYVAVEDERRARGSTDERMYEKKKKKKKGPKAGRRRHGGEEHGALIYELEDGPASSKSSRDSSESDRIRLQDAHLHKAVRS